MQDACDIGCACCGHDHGHDHGQNKERPKWLPWVTLGLSAACLVGLLAMPEEGLGAVLLGVVACLLAGHRIFWQALQSLLRLKINEGMMMLVAAIACFALGDFREAAAIAVFFALGEQLEEVASARSRRSIAALGDIRPDTALLLLPDGKTETVPAQAVALGSEIFVPPHARVPLDGIVLQGESMVDTASLTGESLPRETMPGDALLSGFVNGKGSLVLRTTAAAKDSAASRLLELVEHATKQKGSSERFLARFARVYTPVVMVLGALLAVLPSLITGAWGVWVPRGLMFLVSACPCAIVLSVPLSFFAGIGGAARRGALVKGGRFVELLAQAETFAFDKTGTLTTAQLQVTQLLPAQGVEEAQLLLAAAAAEQHSAHPIARALLLRAQGMPLPAVTGVEEQPGGGVRAAAEDGVILCGSKRLLAQHGVDTGALPAAQVYVAQEGRALGAIRLESQLHPETAQAVEALRSLGVKRFVLLTGDEEIPARRVGESLGFDEVHAALLPEEKLAQMQRLKAQGPVAYVGDGINDAPVLALADVGVAMGSGAQLAAETADMVLAGSSLAPLVQARAAFMRTRRVIYFNVAFALAVKLLVVTLGMFLAAPPIWLAVFADVGVMVITVSNAARLLKAI